MPSRSSERAYVLASSVNRGWRRELQNDAAPPPPRGERALETGNSRHHVITSPLHDVTSRGARAVKCGVDRGREIEKHTLGFVDARLARLATRPHEDETAATIGEPHVVRLAEPKERLLRVLVEEPMLEAARPRFHCERPFERAAAVRRHDQRPEQLRPRPGDEPCPRAAFLADAIEPEANAFV